MKVGVAIYCAHCGRRKAPLGRSVPHESSMCNYECSGYRKEPFVGSLWPGETEEEFGYQVGKHGWIEVEDKRGGMAMSKELMSLDIIEHYRSYFASRAEARMVELCDVAKAAHEWKAKYEVADASLAHNEIVIGELSKKIENLRIRKRHYVMWNLQHRAELEDKLRTARVEERERCANECDAFKLDWEKYVGAIACAAAIRALKDSE